MTAVDPTAPRPTREYRRVLGRIEGEADGPAIVVMAGIHGNEPAGPLAAERVVAALRRDRPAMRGKLVVLAGNLAALSVGTRFVDEDLNRSWTTEKIEKVRARAGTPREFSEDAEQLALIDELQAILDGAPRRLYFLDLHTSSADGPPFLTVGDTLYNRRFAAQFPLPLILGLEEQVDGALLEYLNNLGFVTLGVEAGRHDRKESVERLEAVLWLALAVAGFVDPVAVPERARRHEILVKASRDIPRVIEVRKRHAIRPEDDFRMEPGFGNFSPVEKDQLLARDRHGLVLAPEGGRVLLPLYQGKGNDGFFLAGEVNALWLRVSSIARRLRLGALIHLLPGVRRLRGRREVLLVNTRVARWFSLEIFHLLGFRKLRRSGSELIVSRRRHDLKPPHTITTV